MTSKTEQIHRQANRYFGQVRRALDHTLGPKSAGVDPKIARKQNKRAGVAQDLPFPRVYADRTNQES